METKTALTIQNIIFLRLVQKGVKAAVNLTGAIYEISRPKDSLKEDIVVRTLDMNTEQVQEGVINVNIHLPNLSLTNDSTQPNLPRFREVLEKCMDALQDVTGYDYSFKVIAPGVPYRDGSTWFVNIGVEFWSLIKNN
ncbi:hypothetical protein [Pedobacter gandavensis]|uniref:DUF3168 domain-containing protein n=1 Tax=Pedobacter gandavensis TaxID=2679963 RepID=A0ABR6EU65_9SPHI|nr:hypothetical protein [Pedobacter gandavensis]MBB2148808.1 hypothetical protein [Pedobacter gandavensis]